MSAANRTRGHNAERAVVKYLKANGFPDACTTRAKLGHDGATAPGDIDFHPLVALEVKDVAANRWPEWCRQAAAEARPGMVPVVVRRTRGVTDIGAWPVRLPSVWTDDIRVASDTEVHKVDSMAYTNWVESTMAELVAAVRAVDA